MRCTCEGLSAYDYYEKIEYNSKRGALELSNKKFCFKGVSWSVKCCFFFSFFFVFDEEHFIKKDNPFSDGIS